MAAQPRQAAGAQAMPPGAFMEAEPAAGPTMVLEEVPQTSLANRAIGNPDDVTVRFLKWHSHAATAYQKGQYAGFSRHIAQRLIAGGYAVLAFDPMIHRAMPSTHGMVTK